MNGILKAVILICIARGGPNEKKVRTFKITLSKSNFSAPAKNKDGQSSTLNPRREVQGQIIVCKTLLHSVSSGLLTIE